MKVREFWKPKGSNYKSDQVFKMMSDVSDQMYERSADSLKIMTTNHTDRPKREQIINIVAPTSIQQYMSLTTKQG